MSFYKNYLRPWLFRHDPEEIHNSVLSVLGRVGDTPILRSVIKKMHTVRDERLGQTLFGVHFPNPVGLAAGMDKAGVALRGFESLGFGFIEMGGITALEQAGNPKPRIFRLPDDKALINRMGFNNPGAEKVAYHLRSTYLPDIPLGVNIGKSALTPIDDMEAVANDYCYTLKLLYPFAQFFVVNVSSPNTPGLRNLQGPEFLKTLLVRIQKQNFGMPWRPGEQAKPILLKISPDLSWEELDGILSVVDETGIAGIVATNTTTERKGLKTEGALANEKGGLSGCPQFERTIEVIGHIHSRLPGLPIIGVGGIFSAEDAYQILRAGASLVQIYTGLVYEGPSLPRRINACLLKYMKENGIKSVKELKS